MRTFPICTLCFGLALGACVEWPNVPDPEGSVTSTAWPVLLPLADLGRAPTGADGDLEAFEDIEARAARLRLRASVLRAPVTDQDSFDRLRNRLSR
ncbi:MAG: hypothetical protein HKP37_07205 [Boseongicola sp.]|nr:hypothetical protein [Boseongicola sp.]NNL18511.1 hypothetical protein [Boseongicola sp.]